MKKLNYLFYLLAIPAMAFLASCGGDDEETPTPANCDATTFPATTGKADVQILNFTTIEGDYTVINAKAGDVLSLAIQVTKGGTGFRPQKLRLFQTDCKNAQGNLVTLQTQPGLEDNNTRLDLRNVDDAQIKTVLYTVPTGFNPLYLNIQVDESGDKFTYKRIKVNISNSGIVDTWTGIELGGNTNTLASRLNSATGQTFDKCNAAANIDLVDVTYAVSTGATPTSYLASNPARFLAPISLTKSTASCGEDGTLPTDGGKATYFRSTSVNFEAAGATELNALTVSNTNPQYVQVTTIGTVYEFLNSNGKKGLIKITDISQLDNAAGFIKVSVKVQR